MDAYDTFARAAETKALKVIIDRGERTTRRPDAAREGPAEDGFRIAVPNDVAARVASPECP